jgi:plasmid stabilization system protein ParE
MKWSLVWTKTAQDGLTEVVDFAEKRSLTHAEEVALMVLDRLEHLRALPRTAPAWRLSSDPSFRRLVIGDVVVVYRLVEKGETLILLSVRHGRRRPVTMAEVSAEEE